MTFPEHGFPVEEFRSRTARAQKAMAHEGLAALLLTTAPELQYFTGFLTRFWESPTRPWFLVIPAKGDPVAVIPSIGADLMGRSWISDIRTWVAPDYRDDGIGLLSDTLRELAGHDGRIGVPSGHESHLRMPLESWDRLRSDLGPERFSGDAGIVRALRIVKSDREIGKIAVSCAIADRAFARVPEIADAGQKVSAVFRRFQALCLDEGADWVSYLAGGAGPGGYGDVISPAEDRPLRKGDVLMLDTGLVRDGYFCDFDRNYSIGRPKTEVVSAHSRLIDATEAAFAAARPGATASDLWAAMNAIVAGASEGTAPGRLGHGLGIQLTEWPSLIRDDHTVLVPGMVLTLEPGIELGPGRSLVHEENIVITEIGARYLSSPAKRSMTVLGEGA